MDDYGSDSSDETNQEIDSDNHFDFSNCDTSERSKVKEFAPKHVNVHLEITEIHAALL